MHEDLNMAAVNASFVPDDGIEGVNGSLDPQPPEISSDKQQTSRWFLQGMVTNQLSQSCITDLLDRYTPL